MDTTNTAVASDANRAFITAALEVAYAHNVLSVDDRLSFGLAVLADDVQDAESWARLVVYDLSLRCRSFTPPALIRLLDLREDADAEAA